MKTRVLSPYLHTTKHCLSTFVALACMAVLPVLSHAMEAEKQTASETTIVQFDVSESGPRFVFDEAPVFDYGLPAYGNAFVSERYIFPYGYLDANQDVGKDDQPLNPKDAVEVLKYGR